MNGSSRPILEGETVKLEMSGVHAAYQRDLYILKGIDLIVPDGKIAIVIGANGVGKSTLLKTIAGFLKPSSGSIYLDGKDIRSLAPDQMMLYGIGYIPQERAIFPHMSVTENLEMGCWVFRRDRKRVRERINWSLNRFPVLGEKRKALAGSLSGGQQRTLDIAKTLLPNPSLLLVDEPSVGLSPALASDVYAELRALNGEGKSILLVDQDVESAMAVADEVYVVESGKVKTRGSRAEFEGQLGDLVRSWLV